MDKQIKAIVNGSLIIDNQIIKDKVLLYDKKIIAIEDKEKIKTCEMIDANGAFISAGFIDLHIHGSGGADVMDATPEALQTLCTTLPQTGTTSFLATTMTMSTQSIQNALENVREYGGSNDGAEILGIHLEGPFINPNKHGAQDERYVQEPNFSLIQEYTDIIRMITLAPEMEAAEALIRYLKEHHPQIILSIGHSDASYSQAQQSFGWGISHATHLFNAMNPYHHREPGIVGAVFDADISCDLIADLVHTHPSVLDLVWCIKKEKLILITDAMRAGCMKCGSYDLGGRKVVVDQGKAILEDGTLAGSVLKMNEALYHMHRNSSASLSQVVAMATEIPARKLGVQKGRLQQGYDADIVIFDEDFGIITTIVNGKINYKR